MCRSLFPTSFCGVLVFGSVSRRPPPACRRLLRIKHNSFTYNSVTHNFSNTILCSYNFVTHTIFHTQPFHAQLFHVQLVTYNFVTHNLSHTQLCHRHTHTQSFMHTHTIFHLQLFHIQLCHTPWPSFCLAGVGGACGTGLVGVALGNNIDFRFAWRAWRLVTSTFLLCGRRSIYSTWQAWHWVALTSFSRGRRPWHFAWQAWHLVTSTVFFRGRLVALLGRWHWLPFRLAGVALGDIDLHFAWQVVTLFPFARQVWHLVASASALRGRRCIYSTGLGLVARMGLLARPGPRGALGGRRGARWHWLPFRAAGAHFQHWTAPLVTTSLSHQFPWSPSLFVFP